MLDSLDGFALVLASERRSPHTIRQYAGCIRQLQAFVAADGVTSWDQVTRLQVRRFLASKMSLSASTQAVHHYAIRKFSAYLVAEEDLPAPLLEGRGPVVPLPPVEFPREEQIKRLVAACAGRPRDEAIIRLMADAGLRRAEVARLLLDDLDLSAMPRVRVLGKGSRVRYVAIGSRTALALRRYLKQRRSHRHAASPRLWLGRRGPLSDMMVYLVVRQAGERAGLDVHPHQLRHSWAHHFSAAGGQFNDLVHLGGWARADTAMRYGASAAGERAEAAARRLSLGDRL